ncbi:hypothetical protein Tco_0368845 [Tanacetum coccineum]
MLVLAIVCESLLGIELNVAFCDIEEQEDIDDSLYEYGKYGPQPQSPSPIESDASSTVYSTCQSNDSDGEQGTVSDHSVNDDPIPIPSIEQVTIATQKTQPQVPKPQQTVDPSCAQHVKTPRQPIRTPVTSSPIPSYNRQNWNQRMERELGAGYSFERKPCFVCGSLSHLIKDCDYYEKKMAREAAFKSTRVVHANVRQATPAWTNSNRVNKANQFTPRPVQLNNIRPNLSTASNTIKTGRVNVNTGHYWKQMANLEDYQNFPKWDCYFWRLYGLVSVEKDTLCLLAQKLSSNEAKLWHRMVRLGCFVGLGGKLVLFEWEASAVGVGVAAWVFRLW